MAAIKSVTDVNLWLLGRCVALNIKCSELLSELNSSDSVGIPATSKLENFTKALEDIPADRKAYLEGNFTESINDFFYRDTSFCP